MKKIIILMAVILTVGTANAQGVGSVIQGCDSIVITAATQVSGTVYDVSGIVYNLFSGNVSGSAVSVTAGITPSWSNLSTSGGTYTLSSPGNVAFGPIQISGITAGANVSFQAVLSGNAIAFSDTFNVSNTGTPCSISVTVNGTSTICAGDSTTLTASVTPSGSYAYQWKENGTNISGATSATFTGADTAATYSVVVTGSCTATGSITTTMSTTASVAISPANPAICLGLNATLTASTGTSWVWSNGLTTQSIVVSPTMDTPYWVAATTSCGTALDTVTVVVLGSAGTMTISTAAFGINPASVCVNNLIVISATSGATSYDWYLNGSLTPLTGQHAATLSTGVAGTYTCIGHFATCGDLPSNSIVLIVNALPIAAIDTSGGTSHCAGTTLLLGGLPSGMTSYSWYGAASGSAQTLSVTTQTGYVHLQVTDPNGCVSNNTTTALVTTLPGATANITNVGSVNFCEGGTVHLVANVTSGILWAPSGETTANIYPATTGTRTLTVTNGYGCTATDTMLVTAVPIPVPNVQASVGSFCEGGSSTLSSTPGLGSYSWDNGANASTITVYSGGKFVLTIINGAGCIGKDSITITMHPSPIVSLNAGVTPDSAILVASVSGGTPGFNFLWTDGVTYQNRAVFANGFYNVTVTDTNGCSDTADGFMVSGLPTVGIEEEQDEQINVYPNPSNDIFNVYLPKGKCEVTLTNMLGQQVRHFSAQSSFTFQRESLAKGVYSLKFIYEKSIKTFEVVIVD